MKANELRIGNYLKSLYDGEIKQVDSLSRSNKKPYDENIRATKKDHYIGLIAMIDEEYEPIELTEEWLIKFGFEEELGDYEWYMRINGVRDETQSILGICVWGDGTFEAYKNNFSEENAQALYLEENALLCEIKYVHQLQNLYFALTGQELTIDETK